MMGLKKIYRDELLQIAILVSLMRVDPISYLGHLPQPIGIGIDDVPNGTSWSSLSPVINRRFYIHPKCIDSVLLDYERDIFDELNALGRYNRISTQSDVTAYLLNVNGTNGVDLEQAVVTPPVDVPSEENGAEAASVLEDLFTVDEDIWLNLKDDGIGQHLETELTQEDVDLIEVLWKQDVDLGFSLNSFTVPKDELQKKVPDEDQEKLKALEDITNSGVDGLGITVKIESNEEEEESDPWSGLSYTVDLETGEYILKDDIVDNLNIKDEIAKDLGLKDEITSALDEHKEKVAEESPRIDLSEESESILRKLSEEDGPDAADLPTVSLEEALCLAGLDDPQQDLEKLKHNLKVLDEDREGSDVDEEEDFLNEMIQTAQFHTPQTPHPRTFQASRESSSYTNTRTSWGRMPFVRTVSMEQRWQDLANLLSLPGQEGVGMHHHPFAHHPHHHHHANYNGHNYGHDGRGVLLHNATLAPPMGDLNSSGPYNAAAAAASSMGSSNLGSAVATSMNLTNSSEPIADSGSVFKMENPHDIMYYQNSTSEMNQTTEGFLSSILNDEDLQLMDMAMTEGMYPMRMLESNNTNNATGGGPVGHTEERLDASSDSAVSSMGSERVPSLSDGEWMETGSDSGHNTGDHYGGVDYHSSKFRPFDYSYTGRQLLNSGPSGSGDCHMPPVAQKKHHMFGKRYFQEQGAGAAPLATHRAGVTLPAGPAPTPIKYEYGDSAAESVVPPGFNSTMEPSCGPKMSEVKYSCSLDFIRHQTGARSLDHIHHNHTYPLPSEGSVAMVRPSHRDKAARGRKSDEDHLTRDEKRANAMNIPMPVDEIVNLPMDEFNERLSKYDLSEAQLSLIRDIRRRGKNKVAAQNCRKRKLDQINSLADEVKQMRDRKHRLLRERDYMMAERLRVKEKFSQLYRHVFQALRDPEGNHYSPYEYSLQQSADGTVVLVPRSTSNSLLDQEAPRVKHKDQTHDQHKE